MAGSAAWFAFIGPPAAAYAAAGVLTLAVLAGEATNFSGVNGGLSLMATFALWAAPVGWLLGVAPAALAGLAVGGARLITHRRGVHYTVAVAAGIAAPQVFPWTAAFPVVLTAPASILAALLCTALTGRKAKAREQA